MRRPLYGPCFPFQCDPMYTMCVYTFTILYLCFYTYIWFFFLFAFCLASSSIIWSATKSILNANITLYTHMFSTHFDSVQHDALAIHVTYTLCVSRVFGVHIRIAKVVCVRLNKAIVKRYLLYIFFHIYFFRSSVCFSGVRAVKIYKSVSFFSFFLLYFDRSFVPKVFDLIWLLRSMHIN